MATGRSQVYRCEKCGNMIEVIHEAGGTLVCCGESMKLMEENTVDAAKEKHVPVVEKVSGGVKVRVGSVSHPMEEKHYIEWIQVVSNGKSYREFLKPGGEPEAFFPVEDGKEISVREFCNLHGVWKA